MGDLAFLIYLSVPCHTAAQCIVEVSNTLGSPNENGLIGRPSNELDQLATHLVAAHCAVKVTGRFGSLDDEGLAGRPSQLQVSECHLPPVAHCLHWKTQQDELARRANTDEPKEPTKFNGDYVQILTHTSLVQCIITPSSITLESWNQMAMKSKSRRQQSTPYTSHYRACTATTRRQPSFRLTATKKHSKQTLNQGTYITAHPSQQQRKEQVCSIRITQVNTTADSRNTYHASSAITSSQSMEGQVKAQPKAAQFFTTPPQATSSRALGTLTKAKPQLKSTPEDGSTYT